MAAGDKIKWENADFKWEDAPTKTTDNRTDKRYTWNDIAVLQEAIGGGGDMEEMPWMKWEDEDERKDKLIKLILKVYGDTITESKKKEILRIRNVPISVRENTHGTRKKLYFGRCCSPL